MKRFTRYVIGLMLVVALLGSMAVTFVGTNSTAYANQNTPPEQPTAAPEGEGEQPERPADAPEGEREQRERPAGPSQGEGQSGGRPQSNGGSNRP
jgi:hypothetical protein